MRLLTWLVQSKRGDKEYPKIIVSFGGEEMTKKGGFKFFEKMMENQNYNLL